MNLLLRTAYAPLRLAWFHHLGTKREGSDPSAHIPSRLYQGGHHLNNRFLIVSSVPSGGGGRTVKSVRESLRDCGNETIEGGFEFAL